MISVVIPTNNRAISLRSAIKSALNQNYKDLEVIVVSDGSQDNTDEIVKELQERDSRLKYISYFPARGANYARNMGVSKAEGEFIAFLDDDDQWAVNKLEEQVEVFHRDREIGIVYTGLEVIYEKEGIRYLSVRNEQGDLSKQILFFNCIGSTSSVMVRTTLIKESGGFDENLGALQDYDLWIRLCQLTRVGFVNKPLVKYYNVLGTNQISGQTEKYERADEYILNKYSYLFNRLSSNEIMRRKKIRALALAKRAHRNNNKKVSYEYLLKALKVKFDVKVAVHFIALIFNYKFILKLRSLKK